MVTHLDPSIQPITRSKFIRTLISQKLKKAETDASSLLNVVRCVFISYDLWMSKTKQDIFSMTTHYTRDHIREHARIRVTVTTSTDGKSLAVPVGNIINQFNLGSELVVINSDDKTNLVSCKAILESTFDNTGVFDLEKPMFLIEYLAHVLDNDCKAGVTYVTYYDGRVDT